MAFKLVFERTEPEPPSQLAQHINLFGWVCLVPLGLLLVLMLVLAGLDPGSAGLPSLMPKHPAGWSAFTA